MLGCDINELRIHISPESHCQTSVYPGSYIQHRFHDGFEKDAQLTCRRSSTASLLAAPIHDLGYAISTPNLTCITSNRIPESGQVRHTNTSGFLICARQPNI